MLSFKINICGLAFLSFSFFSGANSEPLAKEKPDFLKFTNTALKKEAFFSYLKPLVIEVNREINSSRKELVALEAKSISGHLTSSDERRLVEIAKNYRLSNFDPKASERWTLLKKRVDEIPLSLVLMQAAIESAYGTSRFARDANNFFGQWCFTKGCGLVPLRRAKGSKHEVKKFASVKDSLTSYFRMLNTASSFENFRSRREKMRQNGQDLSGLELARGLEKYSSLGQKYISQIQNMIKSNVI